MSLLLRLIDAVAPEEPVKVGGGPALSKPARLPGFRFRPHREQPFDFSYAYEPTEEERARQFAEAQQAQDEAENAAQAAQNRLERARRLAEDEETAARLRAVASAERAAYRAEVALEAARLNLMMIDEDDAVALLLAA
jgi:hypothetical protein